ncbi:hypothetical protein B1B_00997 [mine drainage metagenome]|uniref:Uncharacterized protein n=1 Tax=mine drainage metagenome TaxID=410659 RepID=T1BX76_9ZZZZ
MSSTVNFTGAIDRDLLKRAKVIAAKTDTSVNALFNAELRHLVETFESAEHSGNQNFKVLLDFSLGRLAGDDATACLGYRQRGGSLPADGTSPPADAAPAGCHDAGHGRPDQVTQRLSRARNVRAGRFAARRRTADYPGLRRRA